MRIRELELENWGPVQNLKIEIGRDDHIIVLNATNGRGKSTVLEAIGNILSYNRGGNTWGGADMITTGAERGTIRGVFENRDGEYIELCKTFTNNGRTIIRAKSSRQDEPIKVSDRIKEEIMQIFGTNPQNTLKLIVARQWEIAEMLHGEPSVRERQFLGQVNLQHVTEAEARLLKAAREITINEAVSDLLAEAERNWAERKGQLDSAQKTLKDKNNALELLTAGHKAWETWETIRRERTEKVQTETRISTLQETISQMNTALATQVGDKNAAIVEGEIAALKQREAEIEEGEELKIEAEKLAADIGRAEKAEADLKEAQQKAGEYTPADEMRRVGLAESERTLRNRLANEQARKKNLTAAAQSLEKTRTELTKQPEPNATQKTELEKQIQQSQKLQTEIGELTTQKNRLGNKLEEIKRSLLAANTALQTERLRTAVARMAGFRGQVEAACRKGMISETLRQWGERDEKGNLLRCPVSQRELDPNDTVAQQMAQAQLASLEASELPEESNPQKDLQEYLQTKANAEHLTQQQAETAGEIQRIENTIAEKQKQLSTIEVEKVQAAITAWNTAQQNHHTAQINFQNAENQWKQINQEPAQDENKLNLEIETQRKQRETLDSRKGMAEGMRQIANNLLKAIEGIRNNARKAQEAAQKWNLWRMAHIELAIKDLKAEGKTARETRAELETALKTLKEKQKLETALQTARDTLAKKQATPTPKIGEEEAEKQEAAYRTAKTEVQTAETLLNKATAEEKAAETQTVNARKLHETNRNRKRIKDALSIAAGYLNYEQIPREIVNEEFTKVLSMTNGLLNRLNVPITLSHTNFEIFAGLTKPNIGWIYNRAARLSGGEKTITGIAMRLASKRRLAPEMEFQVLDEPTTSVAIENVGKLVDFLQNIKAGLGHLGIEQLIIADHNPRIAEVGDKVISW